MSPAQIERRNSAVELYEQGLPTARVAEELGVSLMTAWRDLKAMDVQFRHSNKPMTEPRVCARDGCDGIFRPTPKQVRDSNGKYCSRECDHEAHRIYAKPDERVCNRDGCEKRFTPTGANVAYGWGTFCSKRCAALSTSAHQKTKGVIVGCQNCGRERWRYDSQMNEGNGNFCSHSCWGKYRWEHGIAIGDGVVSVGKSVTVESRRKWKGRWASRRAPTPGAPRRGRPSPDVDAKRAEIYTRRDQGQSIRQIAQQTKLTKAQVEHALRHREEVS